MLYRVYLMVQEIFALGKTFSEKWHFELLHQVALFSKMYSKKCIETGLFKGTHIWQIQNMVFRVLAPKMLL